MKTLIINNIEYKLPGFLSSFQLDLYVHLINWKWRNITKEVGYYNFKGNQIEYDAILPNRVHKYYPLIYPSILQDLLKHRKKYYFKFHQHFNHMASSQAANVNLFLPILLHPSANVILQSLKPDFKELAVNELYKGFRIEFWDGNSNVERGLLRDHSSLSGTDSDIAIAYYNHSGELCLWLVEHKLTEKEFTECGGYKSKDRNKAIHLCNKSFLEILKDKNHCFHHSFKGREYWNLTEDNQSFFVNHSKHDSCPFKGGMNQLWRNQLLGLGLENRKSYKEAYFSVVKHPQNTALDKSIQEYKTLINNNPKFSTLTSLEIIRAAASTNDPDILQWVSWYRELYKI
jgi:hypothetical protein